MTGLLAALCASIVAMTPLQATIAPAAQSESPDEVGTAIVTIANARVRWNRALDAAAWNRDDPAARSIADQITRELLPLVSHSEHVRYAASGFLAQLAADALGPYLLSLATPDVSLALAYLRTHDDPAVLALLASWERPTGLNATGTITLDHAIDLAWSHRVGAAHVIAATIASLHGNERERACLASLDLPAAPRAAIAHVLVQTWTVDPPIDLDPECALLGATDRAGRAVLTRWANRIEPGTASMSLPAATLAVALANAQLPRTAAGDRVRDALVVHRDESEPVIARLAPWLPLRSHGVRELLVRLGSTGPTGVAPLALARLRAGDDTVAAEAFELLRDPRSAAYLAAALGIAGMAYGRTDAADTALRERLASLREQVRAFATGTINPHAIQRWITAVDDVARCRNVRACLLDLIAHGTDATAARAIVRAGARGIAAMPTPIAVAVAQRLAIHPDEWLQTAWVLTADGCPLPGAREQRVADNPTLALEPFVRAMETACVAAH